MTDTLPFIPPIAASPDFSTTGAAEDFEMAIESLVVQVQVTSRQLDRLSGLSDDPRALHFFDDLIRSLLFFESQWHAFEADEAVADPKARSIEEERLIQGAIWFCEKSAEAEFQFGQVRLANRLRELAKSCHAAYSALPEPVNRREITPDSIPVTRGPEPVAA